MSMEIVLDSRIRKYLIDLVRDDMRKLSEENPYMVLAKGAIAALEEQ